jgi:hypothetical protein
MKDSRPPFIIADFPWPDADPKNPAPLLEIVYDPTNGTVSRGEIFRVGGTKPSGQLYDVLWAATSK